MPGFRNHFDDRQMSALVRYLRATFAPDRPAWSEVEQTINRLRGEEAAASRVPQSRPLRSRQAQSHPP
jgi:nicotinate dehydrogenase subunit B